MKRRQFLKTSTAAAAGTVILPNFAGGMAAKLSAMPNVAAAIAANSDKILVIIQLEGGNDGLNMLVPTDQYDKLQAVRPTIISPENEMLALTGQSKLKLHKNMGGLRTMFDEGKVKFVQSTGFPAHSGSHETATKLMLNGNQHAGLSTSGWLGRFLGSQNPSYPNLTNFPSNLPADPLAVEFGDYASLLLQDTAASMSVLVQSGWHFAQSCYNPNPTASSCSVDTPIPGLPAASLAQERVRYLRALTQLTNHYASRFCQIFSQGDNPTYLGCLGNPGACSPPQNELTRQLQIIARLLNGGLGTRIFLVRQQAYDTHGSQAYIQGENLKELSAAIQAFQQKLDPALRDRVLGMVCSEFGRTIKANGSDGTDHATAHSVFLFGNQVDGGVLGNNPIIPSLAVFNDPAQFDAANNIAMQFDYREIYASILRQWFCLDAATTRTVLGGKEDASGNPTLDWNTLPIVKNSNCCTLAAADIVGSADVCADGTMTYSTPAQTGASYFWTVAGGQIVSGQGTNSVSVKWDASGSAGSVKVQVSQ